MTPHRHCFFALGLVGTLTGCGYHWLYANAPFGAASIAVVPFQETNTVGLAPDLAQELTRRIAAGGVVLSLDRGHADAVLNGRIHVTTGANATLSGVSAYQLTAAVHAELVDQAGGTLWRTDLNVQEDFLPANATTDPQPLATETNRRMALHRLAERAAGALHESLLMASALHPKGGR